VSFYSTVCVYYVVVNKKTSLSGISSPGEFLFNKANESSMKNLLQKIALKGCDSKTNIVGVSSFQTKKTG